MHRLVLLVVRVRQVHRRVAVERDHAVGIRVVDARARVGGLELGVVGVMVQRPGRASTQQVGVEAGVGHARPQPPAEGRAHVARLPQLLPQPGALEAVGGHR